MTAALWFFRADLGGMKGWGSYFMGASSSHARDGTVAIFGAVILFCLPAHDPSLFPPPDLEGNQVMPPGRQWNSFMLVWKDAAKIPWDMVLLFGGGFALANGFVV
jgi:sodium-dependent dicarboxylate transporter 2/3/5